MKTIFCHFVFYSVLLVLLGAILYSPALDNWYSEFAGDDNWMVYENRHVFNLSLENVREYFTSFYRGQYSPVNTLFYGVIYHFFGIDPAYFHGFSLILHIGNVLLVLCFVQQLITLLRKDSLEGKGRGWLSHGGLYYCLTFSYPSLAGGIRGLGLCFQGIAVCLLFFISFGFLP